MKTVAVAASIALLLCACTPPAPADPAADAVDAAPAAASAPAGADAAPAMAATDGDRATNDAIDELLGDHEKYEAVIRQLQQAVAAGDAAKVAGLVEYPIDVDIDGQDTTIEDGETFVARYDQFMTPGISKAIVETAYGDLFVNYKGVMFGDGQAWINGICRDDACDTFDVKVVALQPGAGDPATD